MVGIVHPLEMLDIDDGSEPAEPVFSQRWEYRLAVIRPDLAIVARIGAARTTGYRVTAPQDEKRTFEEAWTCHLGRLGDDGWELVSVVVLDDAERLWFKRACA